MGTQRLLHDWTVTPEKVEDAVRALVLACNPLQIIAFGSRARGDHREHSDLDLAVILDADESDIRFTKAYRALREVKIDVSIVVASRKKYDLFRPWRNSVFHHIDREGLILYDRQDPKSARVDALHFG